MKKLIIFLVFISNLAFAEISVSQVESAINENNPELVISLSNQVLVDHPNSAKAHYFLGQAYFHQDKMNLAYFELLKAKEIDPNINFTQKKDFFNNLLRQAYQQSTTYKHAKVVSQQNAQNSNQNQPDENLSFGLNSIVWFVLCVSGLILVIIVFKIINNGKNKDELEKYHKTEEKRYLSESNLRDQNFNSNRDKTNYHSNRSRSISQQYRGGSSNYNNNNNDLTDNLITGALLYNAFNSNNNYQPEQETQSSPSVESSPSYDSPSISNDDTGSGGGWDNSPSGDSGW